MDKYIGKKFFILNKTIEIVEIKDDEVICNTWDVELNNKQINTFSIAFFESIKNMLDKLEIKGL